MVNNTSPTRKKILPLHLHTHHSILDGASSVEDFVGFASKNKMPVCSCTDHGYVMGIYNLIKACEKTNIKAIPGLEAYLMPHPEYKVGPENKKAPRYFHLTLWAMNNKGWATLRRLSGKSFEGSRVVTTFGQLKPRITWEDLAEDNEGLICGSGCILGPVGYPILRGEDEMATESMGRLLEIFGRDRIFMEIMPSRVVKDYVKKDLVTCKTSEGIDLYFDPKDVLMTPMGEVSAKDAIKMAPQEVWGTLPERVHPVELASSEGEIEITL